MQRCNLRSVQGARLVLLKCFGTLECLSTRASEHLSASDISLLSPPQFAPAPFCLRVRRWQGTAWEREQVPRAQLQVPCPGGQDSWQVRLRCIAHPRDESTREHRAVCVLGQQMTVQFCTMILHQSQQERELLPHQSCFVHLLGQKKKEMQQRQSVVRRGVQFVVVYY